MDYILILWIISVLVTIVVSYMLYRQYYYMAELSPLYGGDEEKTRHFMNTVQTDRWLPWNPLYKIHKSLLPDGTITPDSLERYFSEFQSQRVLYDYLQWI